MLSGAFVVARKELVDHTRDGRGLASAALYTFMGPVILWLVMGMTTGDDPARAAAMLAVMAAVFALVSPFSGCAGAAMDMVAGERERRSLLPLLLNAVSRQEIILGKWLAASGFALAGLLVNVLAFAAIFASSSPAFAPNPRALLLALPALVSLALLAAAMSIGVSAVCRSTKEANTYLSMLIFLLIGGGMLLAFSPGVGQGWWHLAPVAGHERLLQLVFAGTELAWSASAMLAAATGAAAALVLRLTARLFDRDSILYGD